MNFWALSGLINGLTASLFGFFIYFKNRANHQNQLWALFSSTIVFWSLSYFFWQISNDEVSALYFCRSLMAGAIFIPVTFLHFLLSWLVLLESRKKFLYFCYIVSFAALGLDFTPLYVKNVISISYFKYWPQAGPAYLPFFVFWAAIVLYGIYIMLRAMAMSSAMRRNQIKYVLLGAVIGYGGGFTNFPLWYGIKILPYGNILVSVYVALLSYAIIRYRLMDVRVAITNVGIFTIVYALVLGIPFYIGYILKGTRLWYLPLIISTILASGGPFVYTIIRRRAESRLRREEFKAHEALNRLAQSMMRFTKLETLLNLVVHHVVKILKVYSATIYLKDESNGIYHLRSAWCIDIAPPEQSEFLEDSPLIRDILLRKVPILSEELKFSHTYKMSPHKKKLLLELDRANAAAIIPAFKADSLFGFLMLGARKDKRIFSQEDLNLLILLANQAVLAIENAQLFEREKTLMAEKSRRDALADMAPGVAHQFNNRLAAIINSADAQLLLNEIEGDLGKLATDKLVSIINNSQNTIQLMQQEALRGRDIANAILMKGRASLNYIESDLGPVIQSAIELFKVSRTRKSLDGAEEPDIIFEAGQDLPKLVLNESLMQDIFYNLIDNARDAIIMKHRCIVENKITPVEIPYQGKITINAQKQGKSIVVTVSDNGIGMEEKSKTRLFVPYFTTKATSLKGTGMGLWVIRSFIEDHKGKIAFESEYTKGAAFTITFPIRG